MNYLPIKRALDVCFALVLLALGTPVGVVAAFAVKLSSRGPVLYCQQRAGLHGRPFTLYKFRTMRVAEADDGRLLEADLRITAVGAVLRRWSLDELPQLINILRGDMSFIGPRPTMMDQIAFYSPEQARRLTVLPGLTGLAQVSGRNSIPWDQRIELDLVYVREMSLAQDVRILARTIPAALRFSDLYGPEGNLPYRGGPGV